MRGVGTRDTEAYIYIHMVFPITYDISNTVRILYLFGKVYTPRGSPQRAMVRWDEMDRTWLVGVEQKLNWGVQ